ncbi:hypothetical protein RF11_01389 [Thelohanellus kitauei]|uniref:Uncharacterized protein n=1 Tax=Thelohanellus kitauei TaxID=669202 RepID=A0A0C2J1U2_THEKT|nr:hypothetical protein RF11_01389 [Thelohanellus kitauei]
MSRNGRKFFDEFVSILSFEITRETDLQRHAKHLTLSIAKSEYNTSNQQDIVFYVTMDHVFLDTKSTRGTMVFSLMVIISQRLNVSTPNAKKIFRQALKLTKRIDPGVKSCSFTEDRTNIVSDVTEEQCDSDLKSHCSVTAGPLFHGIPNFCYTINAHIQNTSVNADEFNKSVFYTFLMENTTFKMENSLEFAVKELRNDG